MSGSWFQLAGAVVTLLSGVAVLLAPALFARLSQWGVQARGRAEVRVNVGATWLGIGLGVLLMNVAPAYHALGIMWFAIAGARVLSLLTDRPAPDALFWALLAGETLTGVLLFL